MVLMKKASLYLSNTSSCKKSAWYLVISGRSPQGCRSSKSPFLFQQLDIFDWGLEDAGSHVREVPEMQGQRAYDESLSFFAEELACKDP